MLESIKLKNLLWMDMIIVLVQWIVNKKGMKLTKTWKNSVVIKY